MKVLKKQNDFRLEGEEIFKNIPSKIIVENEDVRLEETFRAGKTPEMIVKLMNVIARRARVSDVVVSPVPDHYSNRYGSFVGFFVGYNKNETLRFNFQRSGSSDNFFSIDKYNAKKMMPEYTIDLKGFNVVQVVDYVADILSGEYWKYAESTEFTMGRLDERVTFGDTVAAWLNDSPEIKTELRDVVKSRNSTAITNIITRLLPEFESFLARTGNRGSTNNFGALRHHLRRYFENESIDASGIPAVEVLPGSPETPIAPSSEGEKIYNDLMRNEHVYKFQAMKRYCFEIRNKNPDFKSIYIFGDGGIGKSFWAKKILGSLSQTVYKTGKVSGYTGLVELLFQNREGKILILDDTLADSDMNSPAIGNILKAALDPDPPRMIEVMRGSRRESYFHMGKFYLNEKEWGEFKKFEESTIKEQKKLQEEFDFVDVTTPIDTPSRFLYNSVTVFITNYKKVPQPIQDRCWFLKLEFTNKQILDLIEDSLKRSVPDGDIATLEELYQEVAPDPDATEALRLMRGMEAQGLIRNKLSFRLFNKVVALVRSGLPQEIVLRDVYIQLGN